VAYVPAYGSSRAVEPVHIFGLLGTPAVVQIGSCGGLQQSLRTGDIVLSEKATIGEGASQYYGGRGVAPANLGKVTRAAAMLAARGIYAHRGPTITTDALLAQPDALVRSWAKSGHLGVDMQTSAVFSAALSFGMRAASLLYVWDELPRRSWTDPFTAEEEQAHEDASELIYEIALALA
jgi:uridine phosphorylase